MTSPQVAFSKDFMAAYSELPRKQQKKVREFTEKFRQDPTQSGINFERLEGVLDQKVRSVRIDQSYRAIVIHPPKGDVYLCVWVDHHDEAYRWVRNKRFEVNPSSGHFQLWDQVQGDLPLSEATEQAVAPETVVSRLFDQFDDEDLMLAGVPQPLLTAVRALKLEGQLDALAPHLPEDAAEMLYLLAAGYSLMEAIEEAGASRAEAVAPGVAAAPAEIDTNDFAAALARPESQRLFRIVDNEEELEEMLDAPLDQWRIFLHPSQSKLVRMQAKGPVRVLGSAGTGKTVVLMHRARYLASNVFTDATDRVLVTTFTRNLAVDLESNLRNLCSDSVVGRIEVSNLHKWAANFVRRQGIRFALANQTQCQHLLSLATAEAEGNEYPDQFYRDEWERVVQPQDVAELDDYLTARRVGRGTRLGRKARTEVWNVLRRYRELLNGEGLWDWHDLIREARLVIEKQTMSLPYRAVIADEVQDFSAGELKLLRAIAPVRADTLFLVGDGHQRIYGRQTTLSSCGIEVRGRARRLKLNYRTTEQIRNKAVAVLKGCEIDDLDGQTDTLKGYRSLRKGPPPVARQFETEADEAAAVVSQLQHWIAEGVPPRSICVSARTNGLLNERYKPLLESAGLEVTQVEADSETGLGDGVRLATMHRMKGLEFSRVLLAGVQDGVVPHDLAAWPDTASRQDHELQERCLLYVAMTRARDEVVVMGFGSPSPFLRSV